MRPWRTFRHVGLALAPYALLALAALIIAPVFLSGLPCSDDGIPQLIRAVQLDYNIRGGSPWLQWAPEMMRGYGYPVFAFYAPLTYWPLVGLHALGLTFSQALRLLFFVALLGAGWSAYAFAHCLVSAPASIVAGLAYMFAPYILYDAIRRGAIAELLALAWLPVVLMAVYRLVQVPGTRRVLAAAAALAVLIYTHNLIPLLALPLLGLVGLAGLARRPAKAYGRPLLSLGLSVALGLGLSAAFWLPSLSELPATLSGRAEPPAPELSDWPRYEQHFVPAARLVQWPPEPADPALLNPPLTRNLGVGQAILAAIGCASVVQRRCASRRSIALVLVSVLLAAAWLASDASRFAWEAFSPLRVVQLPTRFLGIASMAAAILGGLGAEALLSYTVRASFQTVVLSLALLMAAVQGWASLAPRYCTVDEPITKAQLANALTYSRWMIEPLGELLPRWVDTLPPADALMDQYWAGQPVSRLSWPPGTVTVTRWTTRPGWDSYELVLAAQARVVYRTFYFLGWQARLDGRPMPISVTPREGLMALDLPAGAHRLEVAFRPTPIRWIGRGLSAFLAVVCLLMLVKGTARRATGAPNAAHNWRAVAPMAGATLLLLVFYFGVVQRIDNAFRADRWQAGSLQGVQVPTGFDFEREVRHLGYSLSPASPRVGDAITLTQYWSALTDIGVPYGMDIRVVDDDGRVWNTPAWRPDGFADYPATENWPTDAYARDAHQFRLLAGTPPGTYWIETSVYRRDEIKSLVPVAGVPTGANPAYARLGSLTVTDHSQDVPAEQANVAVYSPTVLGPGLSLAGWTPPGGQLRSGESAHIELLWRASTAQPPLVGSLELAAPDGHVAAEWPFGLGGSYPSEAWPAPTVVRDQLDLRMAPSIPAGGYTLQLRLAGSALALGQVTLISPDRTFARPRLATTLDVNMGFARLIGFTLGGMPFARGATVTVDLGWLAQAETETSYRVFVHLRDESGSIFAQNDSVPGGWDRPTTGWMPAEYVLDTHTVNLPQDMPLGPYDLVVGLYDPATGQRAGEATLTTLLVE